MPEAKVIAIDQGTSSTRAMVFDAKGQAFATAQRELNLSYPQNGWVEQNPEDIWNDVLVTLRDVYAKHSDAVAIGITNQRETSILWNRRTGQAIYPAIVWQDRRTADYCAVLKEKGCEELVQQKTGLRLDPYFSASKINWVLNHVEGARAAAEAGHLAFGTIDSFLLWRLTDGKVHASDVTNASRTMLLNIHTMQWDDELLALFDIPRSLLPDIKENVASFGETAAGILPKSLPITGMAGDQQAALIGQACVQPGMMKSTYGTGCFALMNIGSKPKLSTHQLLTSIGYCVHGQAAYVLEGSIFVAGAAIQWLRDQLHLVGQAAETEHLAQSVTDNGGVYFIPAFTGLGAPYWRPDVRGAIFGLTRDTSLAHMVRAALEAQAYQTLDLMDSFQKDAGLVPEVLRIDGGLVANEFMSQFLSDMLGKKVETPRSHETTALGAAYLAMLGAGIYKTLGDVTGNWHSGQAYTPQIEKVERAALYADWKKYIGMLIGSR